MKRYAFLNKTEVDDALSRLVDAFLAAKNGREVFMILNSILTSEEKLQIGRRILISECLKAGLTYQQTTRLLKVAKVTVGGVNEKLDRYPEGFELIFLRRKKLDKEYNEKKYKEVGSSLQIHKRKVYTGIKRSEIDR